MKIPLLGFCSSAFLIIGLIVLDSTTFFDQEKTHSLEVVDDHNLDINHPLSDQLKVDYHNAQNIANKLRHAQGNIDEFQSLYGDPLDWSRYEKEDYAFMKQSLKQLLVRYRSIVEDYNTSTRTINKKLFNEKNLPYQLPLDFAELH